MSDLRLAVPSTSVGDDDPLVGRVLQTLGLDVVPHAVNDLCPWQWFVADDSGEFGRGRRSRALPVPTTAVAAGGLPGSLPLLT